MDKFKFQTTRLAIELANLTNQIAMNTNYLEGVGRELPKTDEMEEEIYNCLAQCVKNAREIIYEQSRRI